jgi:Fic family protein
MPARERPFRRRFARGVRPKRWFRRAPSYSTETHFRLLSPGMGNPRSSTRAGRFIRQPTGYKAYEPEPLPPAPPVRLEGDLAVLLSEAERSLGRLDGVATTLPNPDLFVAIYVRREAVLSSQIEGTQASLTDILQVEAGADVAVRDVGEVVRYVAAMGHGLSRLEKLPLSLRLIREMHGELMRGQRGGHVLPGEFRTTQNWIGPSGATLSSAAFVPPPPASLLQHLGALEKFLHDRSLPLLIQAGLAHAQFETIHPFVDGNGRVGRLLITLLLCERGALAQPRLYLSLFLKTHRSEYYQRLQAIRLQGDWEAWLAFFLRGVRETADESTAVARKVVEMRERHRALIGGEGKAAANLSRIHDHLFRHPYTTIDNLAASLSLTPAGLGKLVERLQRLGILVETTGRKRARVFAYAPYLALFGEPVPRQA